MSNINITQNKNTVTVNGETKVVTVKTTGPQGATGAQGPQGIQGIQGIQGPAGNDGSDATVNSTNVNAAGAVMNTDASTADMSFVVDEDNMSSNSATKVPTQQSVKAYVDTEVTNMVTTSGSQTLTNKSIDLDNNTVTNIEVDNFKSGVLDTDLNSVSSSDDTLASAKAIKSYVDANSSDTTYTAGTGLSLSGTTFNVDQIALTTVQTAANESAHLALTTQEGDIVVRSDQNKSYVRNSGTAGTMADFTELLTPTDQVLSVNGNTGAITAAQIAAAVEAASDSNTFTDADHNKLNSCENNSKDDQTAAEIKTLLNSNGIVNSNVDASAAIDGSKISPTFTSNFTATGTEHKFTSGTSGDCKVIIESDTDNNNEADNPLLAFRQDGGIDVSAIGHNFSGGTGAGNNELFISNSVSGGGIVFYTGASNGYTNGTERLRIASGGHIDVAGNLDVGAGIDVTGNIDVTDGTLIIDTTPNSPNTNYGLQEAIRIDDVGGAADRGLNIYEYRQSGGYRFFSLNYNLASGSTGSAYTYTQGNYAGSTMLRFDSTFKFFVDSEVTSGSTDVITPTERFEITTSGVEVTGNITVTGTVDSRDVATDGTKLDGIETSADVTDATNVAAAGALMDGDFTSNGFLKRTGAGSYTVDTNTYLTSVPSGYLQNLSEDTTPQLGGSLDVNGQDIVTTSNGDIELAPDGTGKTILKGNTNAGTLVFNCENNSHGQTVKSQPHSASVTNVLTLPAGADQEIVGTLATQTLTNKTLTSAVLNTGISGSAILDEDDMASNSATQLATQQSIKAYVDAEVASGGGGSGLSRAQSTALVLIFN